MENYNLENILKLHHWNKNLFSIICTRNKNFKFKNGEFILIGLNIDNKVISRAYSIVSSNYENYLEFFSIKVENGYFTSKLKNLKIGDKILISKKPTGTLTIENLKPKAENIWLISTGTGLAPFISLIKNTKIYKIYKKVIIIHSVNFKNDLSYRYYINNLFFENLNYKYCNFFYYPIVTKENFINKERITNLINRKSIFNELLLEYFDSLKDRIMICGNIEMIKDLKNLIVKFYNFLETKVNFLGSYVTEKAFLN